MEAEDLEDYIKHWKQLYKISQKDSMGNLKDEWMTTEIDKPVWETTGEDHFIHATNYFRIALERKPGLKNKIEQWKPEPESDVADARALDIQKVIKQQQFYGR